LLALLWNLSAALRGYLRFYMPTNRVLDCLRIPRGLRWVIVAALVATPAVSLRDERRSGRRGTARSRLPQRASPVVRLDRVEASKQPAGNSDTATLDLLRTRQQTQAAEIEVRFEKDWRKARGKALRRWLD